jgi:hypothetical protein
VIAIAALAKALFNKCRVLLVIAPSKPFYPAFEVAHCDAGAPTRNFLFRFLTDRQHTPDHLCVQWPVGFSMLGSISVQKLDVT